MRPRVDEVISAYARWLRSWGASEATVRSRQGIAQSRVNEWGLEGFTTENVQTWLGRPLLKKWSRHTYYAALADFCTWAEAAGYLSSNPMRGVRKPAQPKTHPRPLSTVEIALVLERSNGRIHDWLLLGLLAGLRAHEIAKMRGEDVDEQSIYVLGKGGVQSQIPTHPLLWEMAQRYPRRGWWFPSVKVPGEHISGATVSNYTGRLFRSLGIDGSVHRARHSYGTNLLRSGANIRTVQQLLRHASLDTTAAYTAVDEDELRTAIDRLTG